MMRTEALRRVGLRLNGPAQVMAAGIVAALLALGGAGAASAQLAPGRDPVGGGGFRMTPTFNPPGPSLPGPSLPGPIPNPSPGPTGGSFAPTTPTTAGIPRTPGDPGGGTPAPTTIVTPRYAPPTGIPNETPVNIHTPTPTGVTSDCSSYRNFEGFNGAPCSAGKGKRTPSRREARPSPRRNSPPAVAAGRFEPNELIIEVEGSVSEAQAIALAQRHRLTRVESQSFPLINSTIFRWRIPDNRSIDTVSRQLMTGGGVKSVQRNYRFALQQDASADPGQYAIARLNLPEAHRISKGDEIRIAVIDSGVDVAHPEIAGVIAGTFEALRSTEGPHAHGTGIAGAIAAHARLTGSAPSARLLAIRAFGATSSGAESTSFVILKSLNYAVEQNAQIINMSFAGPNDPLLQRGVAAAAARGIVLIAAAGNAGPKSPPLYPAADRNVIAVSATDSSDRLFAAANRGSHVAVAAPGVDLLLPAPDEKYQVASGTSFAAAYVSGLAALILERNPGISPAAVRAILMQTARDLGPKGKDDQFGAGLVNALAAVQGARPVTAGAGRPVVAAPASSR